MIADAWARIEAVLAEVLPEAAGKLAGPADPAAIDAAETALGLTLPSDFRASLLIHDGTEWGMPQPVPLDSLYSASGIVDGTRMWRANAGDDQQFDNPGAWAYLIDNAFLSVTGPVLPRMDAGGRRVVVGDMNGDIWWFLDLAPAPGGTVGQVVRVDIESGCWDVIAPSWEQLLIRYAEDLERSALKIDETGPSCEWGESSDYPAPRPEWLRDVTAVSP
ncbi:cell wall assembly regulator SMI1 [Actinoplanes lutulentus]|uniref:Cell wall assembly regulator SMI1 n=1 Tax=Actinoplanes lutulentus TaxID=1287878 RepID=A0A327ZAI5_9ACTN|nr:cell wall assembly regulator SMI1 [Actinoplanes lutulentus]